MQSQSKIVRAKVVRPGPGVKLKRYKARSAIRESQIGLEIVVLQIGKFLDEFVVAKTDGERAEILNRCIHYLSQNTMGSLNLSQLATRQNELLLL